MYWICNVSNRHLPYSTIISDHSDHKLMFDKRYVFMTFTLPFTLHISVCVVWIFLPRVQCLLSAAFLIYFFSFAFHIRLSGRNVYIVMSRSCVWLSGFQLWLQILACTVGRNMSQNEILLLTDLSGLEYQTTTSRWAINKWSRNERICFNMNNGFVVFDMLFLVSGIASHVGRTEDGRKNPRKCDQIFGEGLVPLVCS